MPFPDGNWFNRKRIDIRQLRWGKMFRIKLRERTNRRLLARGLAKSEERYEREMVKSPNLKCTCDDEEVIVESTKELGSWVECWNCGRATEYFVTEIEARLAWKYGDVPYPKNEGD